MVRFVLFIGCIAKQTLVDVLTISVCLSACLCRQQFGLAVTKRSSVGILLKVILSYFTCRYTYMSTIHCNPVADLDLQVHYL